MPNLTLQLDSSSNVVAGKPPELSVNFQTGTTYTLVLADGGSLLDVSNAAATAVTIPLNVSVAFPVGAALIVVQSGVGAVTIQAVVGVAVNGVDAGSVTTIDKFESLAIYQRAIDEWVVVNN